VLVYRTPYGKDNAAQDYQIHLAAVRRGYAVLLQDVRGRYESDGSFDPVPPGGSRRLRYDRVGRAPAVVERQGWHVRSLVPRRRAMARGHGASAAPRRHGARHDVLVAAAFFLRNGVFDLSWLPWIYVNIAPDKRQRLDLPGTRDAAAAAREWREVAGQYSSWLPLRELPYLRHEAPFYFEWLAHAPRRSVVGLGELRGRYAQVTGGRAEPQRLVRRGLRTRGGRHQLSAVSWRHARGRATRARTC
jgi:hypothetical protein